MEEYRRNKPDEWVQNIVQELEGEEAGPSQPKRKTKKVMIPEQDDIEFYVDQVLVAINKHLTSKDAYDLVFSSKVILVEVDKRFSNRVVGRDKFLNVVYNKGRFFCNDWLLNKLKEADNLDRRSFQLLYDEGSMRYEGSHRTIQPATREPNVTGHDIKTDKRNARIFCRFGAYLAMLKVITDNVLVERENEIKYIIELWKIGLGEILPIPENNLIHSEKVVKH
ncbi:unnamed protein product [Meloidogyne enterolobii]|uniref:Uncharacterized protein n=1 Tax=Meloidogyne enterolobii TaxID=390850 RepID=A0ACB1AKN8_MELEN